MHAYKCVHADDCVWNSWMPWLAVNVMWTKWSVTTNRTCAPLC